ncbi:UDP-N-acetylmuramoyl-L-alanyl-D-glutamate--2,6-diaminopimelate ligase [Pillotina sp. SPG140]|jgi:UDP-N-acetylmuramoyl-L-alanyl-D-glutamate--2,6-diaminopimelate ligase
MEQRLSSFLSVPVAGAAGIVAQDTERDPLITTVEYDSRNVIHGSLYCALPGAHTDGHYFITDAVQRGASVIVHCHTNIPYYDHVVYLRVPNCRKALSVIADSFYGFPSQQLFVIGVTGTEGKSTTASLIRQLLHCIGKRVGLISTVQLSDGLTVFENPDHQTTPESNVVHRLLSTMYHNGCEYAVVEASSHGLSERTSRLSTVSFSAAVLTNVHSEHLEFHKTFEQYRDDKANLFRALDKPSPYRRFGVINADDLNYDYVRAVTHQPTFSYGKNPQASVSLLTVESGITGNTYTFSLLDSRLDDPVPCVCTCTDKLPGSFNVENGIAALLTVSLATQVSIGDLSAFVPQLEPVQGRMTAVSCGQPFNVIVDYAHTPASFALIFPELRRRVNGRIISLFGSGGERDIQKRAKQGHIAAQYSDIIILTDEDPRGEDPLCILNDIAAGCTAVKPLLIPDRPTAIRHAFSYAQPGDTVLLLGKGHENSIMYAHKTVPYSEIEEATQALKELGFFTD